MQIYQYISKIQRIVIGLKCSFILWSIFIIAFAVLSLSKEYGYLNLFFSKNYSNEIGIFFKYYTTLGEEWMLILISLIIFILIKNRSFIIKVGSALLINSVITSILKHYIFNFERPSKYFENYNLIFTEGVKIYQYNSFPSGHTSTAFAFAFILTFYSKSDFKGVLLISLAILVGISRIYLQQHFTEDVLAGAVVGFVSAIIANNINYGKKNEF
ncbi:MAG: phosphatase PAP2 family protein [Bacteroidia bacterium]|nr:phosphatase PAP2 family protein [Bacteroidia bacterium]